MANRRSASQGASGTGSPETSAAREAIWAPPAEREFRKDIDDEDVQDEFVINLERARRGQHPTNAKPWTGSGPQTYELKEDGGHGDTYRCLYTVRYVEALYVLHVFKKKSKEGIKTPLKNIRTVDLRSKWADQHWIEHFSPKARLRKGDRPWQQPKKS